jgi:hypothetical protein
MKDLREQIARTIAKGLLARPKSRNDLLEPLESVRPIADAVLALLCTSASEGEPKLGPIGDEYLSPSMLARKYGHALLAHSIPERGDVDLLKGELEEACSDLYKFIRENIELRKALEKLRSYNVDIAAGRINYRPHDHILVIDKALSTPAPVRGELECPPLRSGKSKGSTDDRYVAPPSVEIKE